MVLGEQWLLSEAEAEGLRGAASCATELVSAKSARGVSRGVTS